MTMTRCDARNDTKTQRNARNGDDGDTTHAAMSMRAHTTDDEARQDVHDEDTNDGMPHRTVHAARISIPFLLVVLFVSYLGYLYRTCTAYELCLSVFQSEGST